MRAVCVCVCVCVCVGWFLQPMCQLTSLALPSPLILDPPSVFAFPASSSGVGADDTNSDDESALCPPLYPQHVAPHMRVLHDLGFGK